MYLSISMQQQYVHRVVRNQKICPRCLPNQFTLPGILPLQLPLSRQNVDRDVRTRTNRCHWDSSKVCGCCVKCFIAISGTP